MKAKPRIYLECCICNDLLELHESKFKYLLSRNPKYLTCGKRECVSKAKTKYYSGKDSPIYKGKDITCPNCNKTFHATGHKLARLKTDCKNIFCSKQCYREHKSKHYRGKNNPQYNSKKYVCEVCKKIVYKSPWYANRVKHIYCSKECTIKGNSKTFAGDKNPAWRGGISYEPYGPGFNKNIKKYVFDRDGGVCQICHKLIVNGHNIHHKDYNKKNNEPNNLILLCIPCHSQTNTNRDYWQDYFKKTGGPNLGLLVYKVKPFFRAKE